MIAKIYIKCKDGLKFKKVKKWLIYAKLCHYMATDLLNFLSFNKVQVNKLIITKLFMWYTYVCLTVTITFSDVVYSKEKNVYL